MSAKHTPGPWIAVGYQVEIESETVADICTTNAHLFGQPGLHNDATAMANARLIAAAPDMLEVLEELLWLREQQFKSAVKKKNAYERAMSMTPMGLIKGTMK